MNTGQARTVGCRLALLLLVSVCAVAQSSNLKADIEHRWKGKVFFIKGWYDENNLTYDASGSVLGNPKPGPWTAGGVQIHSVKVQKDKIVLKGPRVGFVYDHKKHKFSPMLPKDFDVTITIKADPSTLTPANLDLLQNGIFATQGPIADEAPDYWREVILHGEQDPAKKPDNPNQPDVVEGMRSGTEPVFRIGPAHRVSPPRIVTQFEPEYTELARKARYQGTSILRAVVDSRGETTQVQILRPLGMGLDDQAVNVVRQWRFEPAKRDGKPVAVTVDIEVNFRLY